MPTTPLRTSSLLKFLSRLALVVYSALVLYIVFFSRRRRSLVWSPDMVNLVPLLNTFRDHRHINDIGWWNYWENIFGNIALFVPMPAVVASSFDLRGRWLLLGIGVAVSVLIEVTQYVWEIGIPDIDDVIFNSVGAMLGVLLWELACSKIQRRLS